MSKHPPRSHPALGKLSALGPQEPWQTALLLPAYWDNLQTIHTDFSRLPRDPWIACAGRLAGDIDFRSNGKSAPRIVGYITDGLHRIGFTVFGDTRTLADEMTATDGDLILYGERSDYDGTVWLRSIQLIEAKWIGRLRPYYAGKARVISPDTVRKRMIGLLGEAVPIAERWLLDTFKMSDAELVRAGGCDPAQWSLSEIIKRSHLPRTLDEGRAAQAALERIAALGVVRESAKYYLPSSTPVSAVSTPRWDVWANRIPFTLAQEQEKAINEILQRHYSGRILRHCLSGDVGTGKTAVYGTVAATALSSGQRVAIMLPNETLARQTYTDLSTWWPELCPRFISGSSKPDGDLRQNQFLIGTQALLFANLGKIDLLIVDEQQKFSREQREKLLDPQTGLLEVTATCIPRSQALIRFGTLSMSKLRQGHVQKTIHTRIWRSEGRRQLMFDVRQTIDAGAKVLVVYPKRDRGGQDSVSILPSAEEAFSQWDRLFPDKVRLAHGGLDDNLNEEAILDLRTGKASILVSTSLVEVGINIPNLRRCVVVHAERFGLSTLHQMRGRVARDGGVGYCDLMLPNPVKEDVDYRLQILEATSDGFEVAEHDMAIRGFGNLAPDSERQSGFDETFLFGRPLKPELLDAVLNSIG